MKTLYIDINNAPIEGNAEIEVLSYDLQKDFYYSLGESIKGKVRGVSSNIDLVEKYIESGENAKFIEEAWKTVKEVLFSENSEEDVTITLPQSYLEWLRYNNDDSYRNIYEQLYSGQRSASVKIDMKELYEDAVGGTLYRQIRRCLKDDADIEELVFNDNCASRKSVIVRTIKKNFENVGFIPFEKWEDCSDDVNPKDNANDISSDFIFALKNCDGCYDIYNKDGDKISTVKRGFSSYRPPYATDNFPYIIGDNPNDDKLYFISSERVQCLGVYRVDEVIHESRIFSIKDKFDYFTYYKIKNGKCEEITREEYGLIRYGAPYYWDEDDDDMITCVSSKTGRPIEIPGFKAFIYLGHNGQEDIFWATKKCSPNQYKFKESFIVNIKGEVLRNYEYHLAAPLGRSYIQNMRNGFLKAITDLDGNVITKCNIGEKNGWGEEIESGVYKFSADLFWLEKENIFCHHYNRHFYGLLDENGDCKIYKREDNAFIGNAGSCGFVKELADDVYYVESDIKGDMKYAYLNKDGVEIYSFTDENHESPHKKCPEGSTIFQPCGVSENRIIINVDDRYYKILDYEGNEIKRLDFGVIADSFHNGKLFYYTADNDELGYYDYQCEKHPISFFKSHRRDVGEIIVLKNNMLLIKNIYEARKEWVVNAIDGTILLKEKHLHSSSLGDFIYTQDDNYDTVIYNLECKKLLSVSLSPTEIHVMNSKTIENLKWRC